MANREQPVIPANQAWGIDARKQMMRAVVTRMAMAGELHRINPVKYAQTYSPHILPCEVEAEMLKHLTEGEAK